MPKRSSKDRFTHPYDTDELIKICLDAIKKNPYIWKVTELIASVPFGRTAWNNHKLSSCDEIHEALDKNRQAKKLSKKKDLDKSDNAAAQIAFYKLAADQDELDKLKMESKEQEKDTKADNTLKIKIVKGGDKS